MLEKSKVVPIFKTQLKRLNFTKTRTTWHRTLDDVIHVVMLKKSGYGEYYDLNTSLFLRALDNDKQFPAENHCHLRARVEKAFPDEGDRVMRALVLDYPRFREEESIEILESFLSGTYARFVDAHLDLAAIRRAYNNKELDRFMTVAIARGLLEKDCESA